MVDGEIVAAAQEERFTRKKHDYRFPASRPLLPGRGGPHAAELDFVGFYDKPLLKFDRLLETYLAYAPRGFASFLQAMPCGCTRSSDATCPARAGQAELGDGDDRAAKKRGKDIASVLFGEHHECHAASAFFPSPFEEAAILTLDGVGEWATARSASAGATELSCSSEMRFPHSLGLLYSRLHLLLRLQGQQRRVQADGPGALRRAALRRADPSRS